MDTENGNGSLSRPVILSKNEYRLKAFQSSLNLLANILIGIVVGAALMFSFRSGLPIGATPTHVTLCVLGYHLLMTQAILSLCPHNGWSANLKIVDRRRAHWILQIVGSGLAIAGSFIKILDKTVHWNTTHGCFALVALVFTVVSLVNGLVSLWIFEIRKFIPIPANITKLTHICFGVIGFTASTIALCYGINKTIFTSFLSENLANTLTAFIAFYTAVIITNPIITFVWKIRCK